MRYIDKVIVHCSDSQNPAHDDIKVIDGWHKSNGWQMVGYHFFIKSNGEIQEGRNVSQIGAHTVGYNKTSIGICLHGKKEFTKEQFEKLAILIKGLMLAFKFGKDRIYPHHHFNAGKTCPNFDVKKFIEDYLS